MRKNERTFAAAIFLGLITACGDGTIGERDAVAPTVVSTIPNADATLVPVDTTITVTFSEEVDPATVNGSSFFVAGVAANVAVTGKVAQLTPQSNLTADTTYQARVTTGVLDEAGNALPAAHAWAFSTGAAIDNLATLTWEAPTTNVDGTSLTDLAGYKVFHGTTSRTDGSWTEYDTSLDVGISPICSTNAEGIMECIHVLFGFAADTTYYFAVTAYDTSDNESVYSNEADKSF